MKRLGLSFYNRPTLTVARELLGKILVCNGRGKRIAGRIVETEGYLGEKDPGSHAYKGVTARNRIMFGRAGRAYVYFCYGCHDLFNIVTEREGKAGAVLIRALEPVWPKSTLLAGRTNGPGKWTRAFGVSRRQNGQDLTRGPLYVADDGDRKFQVERSTRIGIQKGKELPYRFMIQGNPFLSKRPARGKRS